MNEASNVPGPLVSQCLDLRNAPYLQSVADAIDAVHTDGALPVIKVERAIMSSEIGGLYDSQTIPPRITVARQTLNADLSFLHEVGHFIDHQGIDIAGQYASAYSPDMEQWRNTVRSSASITELQRLRSTPDAGIQRYINYLLDDREIFARCYVQYIAFKSQHPGLIACIREDYLNNVSLIRRNRQWQEHDFIRIADEIDNVFKQRKWIP